MPTDITAMFNSFRTSVNNTFGNIFSSTLWTAVAITAVIFIVIMLIDRKKWFKTIIYILVLVGIILFFHDGSYKDALELKYKNSQGEQTLKSLQDHIEGGASDEDATKITPRMQNISVNLSRDGNSVEETVANILSHT